MYKAKQIFTISLLTFGLVQGCSKVFAGPVDEPKPSLKEINLAARVGEYAVDCDVEERESRFESERTESPAEYIKECLKDRVEFESLSGLK